MAVLLRMKHERWCDYVSSGACACEAGQALIDLLAVEQEAARPLPLRPDFCVSCEGQHDEMKHERSARPLPEPQPDLSLTKERLADAIYRANRYVFQTADPCTDPTGTNYLTPEDAAEDILEALGGALPDRPEPSLNEAINMLRRIVAAREMAWLDDEIEGAKNWLARLSQLPDPATHCTACGYREGHAPECQRQWGPDPATAHEVK